MCQVMHKLTSGEMVVPMKLITVAMKRMVIANGNTRKKKRWCVQAT